jgi:hypothetical protein
MAVGHTAGQQGQTSPGLALVDAQEDAENAPKGERCPCHRRWAQGSAEDE